MAGAGSVAAAPLTSLPLPALLPGTLPNRPSGAGAAWTQPAVKSGSATYAIAGNAGVISQSTARATLEWNNFNIARNSAMEFKQPDSSAVTLNRVLDPGGNPSQISGSLKANGQVYLINQNGILFGDGAQVDTGALVASALNIGDEAFNSGLFANKDMSKNTPFVWGGDRAGFLNSLVQVGNGASITSANGGFVMLLGPKVENNGVIVTPGGQTVLAAGAKVYLAQMPPSVAGVPSADSGYHGFLVEVDPYRNSDGSAEHGSVLNAAGGQVSAPRGNATLVGYAINQEGRISATTSVNQNGIVRLLARDTAFGSNGNPNLIGSGGGYVAGSNTGGVVMGRDSKIEITPEAGDQHTIQDAQKFYSSIVDIAGSKVHMLENGSIKAAGGTVSISAQREGNQYNHGAAPANGSRVYLAAGSAIDVAGVQGVPVSAERNVVEVDLRGSVVQDYPLVRDGYLYGKRVWVDIRKGTPIADISSYVAQTGRTAAEKSATGGKINIRSEGDIILRDGSLINFSGGSIDYSAGPVRATRLISQDKLIDIAAASADTPYSGIAGEYTVTHPKWGVTETFRGLGQWVYSPAYREGKNAGEATFIAPGMVLDGTLLGKTTPGPLQRNDGAIPLSGSVVVGDSSIPLYGVQDVVFAAQKALLPADFTAQGEPQGGKTVTLSSDLARGGGIGSLAVYSAGKITLPAGVGLDMTPGSGSKADGSAETSKVILAGNQIDIDGTIHALSGNISLKSAADINIGTGGELAARGAWVNDAPPVTPAGEIYPALINGGSIKLQAGRNATLAEGSLIDVSGGAKADAGGKITGGGGGSISISSKSEAYAPGGPDSPLLTLNGELRGYGVGTPVSGGKGGSLELAAQSVRIGPARTPSDPAPSGELLLAPAFFQQGGFASYKVTGQNGLAVVSGSEVHPLAARLVLDPSGTSHHSGEDIYSFSRPQLLPLEQRQPSGLAFSSSSLFYGNLSLEHGAAIRVDPAGSVSLSSGRQLSVLGSVDAPAGKIALSTSAPGDSDDYNPDQSIWIGSSARLDATGYAKYAAGNTVLRKGEVLRGGDIAINAGKGYVIIENGAELDVSGLAPVTLDLAQEIDGHKVYAPVSVPGDAGSISITAREGAFLDGTLLGRPGGGSAAGGLFSLSLLRPLPGRTGTAFKTAPVSIVVRNSGNSVPDGLKIGGLIDDGGAARNGKAFMATDTVKAGGFDGMSLKSQDTIEFQGEVDATLRRSITLDAANLASTGGGNVNLSAAYVSIGRGDPGAQNTPAPPKSGSGRFAASAHLLDLEGNTAWQGFGQSSFTSSGDIRLKGGYNPMNPEDMTLKGGVDSGGDLQFTAKQIYPASFSDFSITANIPGGAIAVQQWAAGQDSPVLSAGGKLALNASAITQQGVLKAPFGSIVLHGDSVTLAPGSVTSVSAEGLTIPFGRTQLSGREYAYGFNGSAFSKDLSSAPPEKRVQLNAGQVNVQSGATVNLAGGGDLYAYEFIPGRGGSRDMLDPMNAPSTFAILPRLKSAAAYDYQEYRSGEAKPNLKAGDGIYLPAPAGGLAAGFYPLLPAHYALLEGSYLVTPVDGHRDMLASQSLTRLDGSSVVPGYLAAAGYGGGMIRDTRTSGFAIAPGAIARTRSEFRDTYASGFYAASHAVQSTADAGRFSAAANNALLLNGRFLTAPGKGGRGAEVDISAQNIVIGGESDASTVALDAATLNNLGADSLLIGGIRSSSGSGVTAGVGANSVTVNGGANLEAPEIILAATGQVTVRSGARVEGKGKFSGSPQDITINNAGTPNSYGALLRASSGGLASIVRPGTIRDGGGNPIGGRLTVENGASVRAGKSLMLDASVDSHVASGSITLGANAELGIGARRISLGDAGNVSEGLVFSDTDLAQFNRLDRLALTSYSTLDLYGNVTLGNDLLDLDIQAAGVRGLQGSQKNASIRAGAMTFSNPGGIAVAGGTGQLGDGNLAVAAGKIVLGKGAMSTDGKLHGLTIEGFDNVTLSAASEITGSGAGRLDVGGNLVLQAVRVTGEAGAQQAVAATGNIAYVQPVNRDPAAQAGFGKTGALGAHFDLRSGGTIMVESRVDLPSGSFTASAAQGVTLAQNAQINAGGGVVRFADTAAYAPGGKVELVSDRGNVNIDPGARVDVAGAAGGDAGSLAIRAANGEARIAGVLKGYAGADATGNSARQGSFTLDVAVLGNFSSLNGKLATRADSVTGKPDEGGFGEAIDVRVRSGSLSIAANDTVKAHQISLAADSGSIGVAGKLDASGEKGGSIGLYASGDVTLKEGAALDAFATLPGTETSGTAGRGGKVMLAVTGGNIETRPGSSITASGAGNGLGGNILFRAPRNGRGFDLNVTRLAGSLTGAREIVVEGFKVYNKAVIGSADVAASIANPMYREALNFTQNAGGIKGRIDWNAGGPANLRIQPGIEIVSGGDIALDALWNLYNWRFKNFDPGVLTLRAAGDLNINKSLSDGFNVSGISGNTRFTLATLAHTHSWSYRLVAGADPDAANPLAVKPLALQQSGKGSLVVAPGIGYKSATAMAARDATAATLTAIRTGTGDISIAAGRDMVLGNAESVIYTAGRPGSLTSDFYGYPLYGTNSSGYEVYYPWQGGNVAIRAQGDITGAVSGLTTAGKSTPMQMISDWLYRRGKADAGGNIAGSTTVGFNTLSTSWLIYFPRFEQNIGALGGGDVSVVADGSINNLSVVIPTNAWLGGKAGGPMLPSSLHVNGGGDLMVRAGKDIAGGLFYVSQGKGVISAGNSLAAAMLPMQTVDAKGVPLNNLKTLDIHPILALDNGSFRVQAGRDLNLEAAINATAVSQAFGNSRGKLTSLKIDTDAAVTNFYTYTPDSSISLSAISGNIHLFNNSAVIKAAAPQLYAVSAAYSPRAVEAGDAALRVYPPSLRVAALQGDVTVGGSPTLFPSASGNLELLARGAVSVEGVLRISDAGPAGLSTATRPALNAAIPASLSGGFTSLLHQNDDNPVRVCALTGDITGGTAYFPKQAQLAAGRDIVNLNLQGQNLRSGDTTRLAAGRDIKFTSSIGKYGSPDFSVVSSIGLTLGGPGRLEVVAGRNVDLDGSGGIVTRGNIDNPALPGDGANIVVLAGANPPPEYAGFSGNYSGYQDAGYVAAWQRAHPEEGVPSWVNQARYDIGGTAGYSSKLAYAFFDQLKLAGAEHNTGKDGVLDGAGHVMGYRRGYQAAATLFPGNAYSGDINLFFSQVKTERGGDIDLLAPGGLVNAGLDNPAYSASIDKNNDKTPGKTDPGKWIITRTELKGPNQLGIVTVDGGSIRSFTRNDFQVNQSRVFTLGGGDILLWSSEGNIDAGKGAKTASATPPPVILFNPKTGITTVDTTNAVSGSGIGVLLAKDGITPGNTDLIAPKGEVNAGDAGIRAAGNLNIAALRVVGAENIQFGGVAAGIPAASTGGLGAELSGAGNIADAANAANVVTRSLATATAAGESMQRMKQAMDEFRPSFIRVEVIGLGEDSEKK